jgi:hypothetical protein
MAAPTLEESLVYKSRVIKSQVRAAVEIDYPVFSGHFEDDFDVVGPGVDDAKWFSFVPSWGLCLQESGNLRVGTTSQGVAPAWIQSKHNLAFPISRETDWVLQIRAAASPITGYGSFIRICGTSFRDAEAIVAIKANAADGLIVTMPDATMTLTTVWSNGADSSFNRYRVTYDASAQTYTVEIDADDDGTYEIGPFTAAVDGRYADAVVIGNSTAIQGAMGDFTEWKVDWIDIVGTAEVVEHPSWAAPFTYDGTVFSYLPTILSGRVAIDKRNLIDAAELTLDNFGLDDSMQDSNQLYTWFRFLNRRCIIEGRAGDDQHYLANWEILFDGLCAEKQVRLQENGRCIVTVPIRDRWRATADDMEINACYSDAGTVIDGVGMNMTVAEILEDIYREKCNMAIATHNVDATPSNIPRNYNIFRESAQQAVKTLAEQVAMTVYQRISDGRIEVHKWPWGTDTPVYYMSTAEEIKIMEWTESAFDVISALQMSFENTNDIYNSYTHQWPPHRQPFYGKMVHEDAVTVPPASTPPPASVEQLVAELWWGKNRDLGSVVVTALAQFWVEHDMEIGIKDDRFLGFGRNEFWMIDGWEHSWEGDNTATTRIRLINLHPDKFLRYNLMP